MAMFWRPHILDWPQLFPADLTKDPWDASLARVGSGQGCPGLILSFSGSKDVHLVGGSAKFLVPPVGPRDHTQAPVQSLAKAGRDAPNSAAYSITRARALVHRSLTY